MSYDDLNQPFDVADLDNEDLSNVPTGMPVFKPVTTRFMVKAIRDEPQKNGKTGTNRIVELTTLEPLETIEGETVQPGYTIMDRFSLSPTEKYPVTRIKQKLAEIREAVTGSKSGGFGSADTWPSSYFGQEVLAKLKVEHDKSGQFADKSAVAYYVKRKG